MGCKRHGPALCAAALLTIGAACGDEPVGTVGAGVVQITFVSAAPTSVTCPNINPMYVYVRLVNTRADTVRISQVSSAGIITASSAEGFAGQTRFTYETLPYSEIVLRPRDGEAQTTVIISTPCPSSGGPTQVGGPPPVQRIGANGFVEAYLTLFVKTNAGAYATQPITIRFNYPQGG